MRTVPSSVVSSPLTTFVMPVVLAAAVLALCLVVVRLAAPQEGAAQIGGREAADRRTVSFTGLATVRVPPDRAQIVATVEATGDSSEQALTRAGERAQRVARELRRLNISGTNLQTRDAYTYRDYESGAWTSSVTLRVRLTNPQRAARVMRVATRAGAADVSGPSYSLEETGRAHNRAVRQAIEDARRKAAAAAQHLNVSLGEVVTVEEQEDQDASYYENDWLHTAGARSRFSFERGSREVTAEVRVSFELRR